MTSKIVVNNIEADAGVSTVTFNSNVERGTSNLHSVGLEAAGINVLGADTPIGSGSTIYDDGGARFSGIVTATSFSGDGSQLSGISVDSTKIETGNTKVETIDTGSDGHIKITTEGSERLRINAGGDMNLGSGATVAGLRYLDVQNSSSAANNHGSIFRLITSNAAGNSTTSVDIVKYKDGNFFINNNETSGSTNFNTGGATRLTIHASGAVTKPNNPSFRANRSEGSNYTSTTLNEILPWNVVEFDRTNVSGYGYNNSTYKYRVAVAGVYWFHCAVYTDTNVDVMFDIVKNNNSGYIQRAELRQSGGDDIGNNSIVHCAGISQCAVGDYIYVNNSGGSAIELIGGGAEGYIDFSGYLIG